MFDFRHSAAIVLSDEFNTSDDADLLLVSSDGVGYRLSKKTLSDHFAALQALAATAANKGGVPEVPVDESSVVLEAVLPYVFWQLPPPFRLDMPQDGFWLMAAALAKYEIRIGLAEMSTAFRKHEVAVLKNPDQLIQYYLFAFNFHPPDLDHAVSLVLKPGYEWAELELGFRLPSQYDVTDNGKLRALLARRTRALAAARATRLTLAISRLWQTSRTAYPLAILGEVLELWVEAASCTSLDRLAIIRAEQERQLQGAAIDLATRKLPWAELKAVIGELPERLE